MNKKSELDKKIEAAGSKTPAEDAELIALTAEAKK